MAERRECPHDWNPKISRMVATCRLCGDEQPIGTRKPRVRLLRGRVPDLVEVDLDLLPTVNVVRCEHDSEGNVI